MGKSFAYNDGSNKDEIKAENLHLTFGIFIDGTLNNKDNTDMRTLYSRTNTDGEINYSIGNKELEHRDGDEYKEIKNKGRIEELLSKRNKTPAEQIEFDAIHEKTKYLVASHRVPLNEFGLDRMGTDNSYSNDYTNVARMWQCCEQRKYAIYVPGMGTDTLMRDSTDGFAFGSGQTGIRARVRYACEQIADSIAAKIVMNDDIVKLIQITIDVFGFSRGAATARNLVYELNLDYGYHEAEKKSIPSGVEYKQMYGPASTRMRRVQKMRTTYVDVDNYEVDNSLLLNNQLPKMGHLGYSLLKKTDLDFDELQNIEITIRFVGIYDTVSSYYEQNGIWDHYDAYGNVKDEGFKMHKFKQAYFNNDIEELHLNALTEKKSAGYNSKPKLDNLYCQKLVHFTAKDEHRENFTLTRIKQAKGRFIEKNFPGVHCDIGGAYINEKEVIDEIGTSLKDKYYVSVFPEKSFFLKPIEGLDLLREDLIRQYWYTEKQIEVKTQWDSLPVYEKLVGTRGNKIKDTNQYEGVKKEYSYIPLHFMETYARTTEMKDYFVEESGKKFPLDAFLTKVEDYLSPYALDETNQIEEWDFMTDEEIEKQKLEMLEKQQLETEIKSIDEKRNNHTYEYEDLKRAHDNISKPYQPRIDLGTFKIPKEASDETELYKIDLPELNVKSYNSQKMLRQLRNEYLHWSSTRDWFGMQPNEDRKRKIL